MNVIELGPCFQYSIDAMFLVDDHGVIIDANEAAAPLLSKPHDDFVSSHLWNILPHYYRAEMMVRWGVFIREGNQDGLFVVNDKKHRTFCYRYRLLNKVINQQFHLVIIADISKSIDTNPELVASEERYRRLNSIYPIGIFHADCQGNDVYVNEKACEIMGLSFEECMGDGWQKNLHPDDAEKVVTRWVKSIRERGYFNLEYRFIHADGNVRWVHVQSVPEYDGEGKITHFVGTLTDITQLYNAQQAADEARAELSKVARLTAIGEMASGIAHELNQPLTAISNYALGCIRRFKNARLDANIEKAIREIAKQAKRSGEIIHHLKDFLRHGDLQKESTNINDLIRQTIQFMETSFEKQNTALRLKLDETIPELHVDPIHIQQVIANILTNALESIHETTALGRYIQISSESQDNKCKIHISDSGPGVPKELSKKIFTPFFTTKPLGTGIGLALSHTIIQRHDGELIVCTNPEHGSCFRISLPYE